MIPQELRRAKTESENPVQEESELSRTLRCSQSDSHIRYEEQSS